MKRIYVLILSAVLLLTACSTAPTQETTASDKAITFTDDLGREISVDKPERVACMTGSFADIWMLAGGEVVAAAHDTWTSFDLDLADDVVDIGSLLEPDTEKLIAAKPDLIIASANLESEVKLKDMFEHAGITVAYFEVESFNDYLNMLNICTDITGRKDLYKTYGSDIETEIEDIKKRADDTHPTILYLRATSDSVKAKRSEDTVGSEILKDLGCVNIADSDENLIGELSMEEIVLQDPEYIFITMMGSKGAEQSVDELLISNPAWNSLSAVKNGKYYILDKDLYNTKPNSRWGEAYEKMADILYSR